MSHSRPNQASSMEHLEADRESRHQTCCVGPALRMSKLYHQGQMQLHNLGLHFQAAQNEVRHAHQRLATAEQELQREREAHELLHQQLSELQEYHCKLMEEHKNRVETLEKSARDSEVFADEVARQAEGLVRDLQVKLAGTEVDQSQKSQSISGMILESAKNALLVEAVSSEHSQEEHFVKLKFVMDQNVELQQRIEVLSGQNKTLSRQVENGKSEVASLNKALELTSEDGRRKKPRRGKMSAGKG